MVDLPFDGACKVPESVPLDSRLHDTNDIKWSARVAFLPLAKNVQSRFPLPTNELVLVGVP